MTHKDPKSYLLAAMNDENLDDKMRMDAAKALLPYMHKKLGEGGKKDEREEKSKEKSNISKFKPRAV